MRSVCCRTVCVNRSGDDGDLYQPTDSGEPNAHLKRNRVPSRMQRMRRRLPAVRNSLLERRQPQADGPLHCLGLRVHRNLPPGSNVNRLRWHALGRCVRSVRGCVRRLCKGMLQARHGPLPKMRRGMQAVRRRVPQHGEVVFYPQTHADSLPLSASKAGMHSDTQQMQSTGETAAGNSDHNRAVWQFVVVDDADRKVRCQMLGNGLHTFDHAAFIVR